MKFLRKFYWQILAVFIFSFFFTPSLIKPQKVLAQDTPEDTLKIESDTPRSTYYLAQDLIDNYMSVIDPENGGCDTPSLECLVHNIYQFVMIETYYQTTGSTQTGFDNTSPTSKLPTQSKVAYQGAIGGLFSLIDAMYAHPIASSRTYVADVAQTLNLAPPVYAQGLGFSSLNPILNVWKTFRNIAYLFFVVIFIVIGFMIMFRAKVGQAAVTAQQAIPNVIIALILVTFSYAIAGFIIDLMYLSMVLIQGLFQPDFGGRSAISMNFIDLVKYMFTATTGWGSGGGLVGNGGTIVSELLKNAEVSGWVNSFFGFIGGLTLTVVIAIAILIAAFKLFFELLRAYATAVVHIVLAPLELMIGAIPGQNVFVKWFKAVVGNLLPFPTVLFVITLYGQFTSNTLKSQQGGFMPPFMWGSGQGTVIAYVMGLALMLALPEIVKHVREGVGGKGGIGEMIASAFAVRALQGTPIATKAVGGATLAAASLPVSMFRAWKATGKDVNPINRLILASRYTAAQTASAASRGARLGGSLASSIGGKTPSSLGWLEKAVDGTYSYYTPESIEKRTRSGGRKFSLKNILNFDAENFDAKINAAKATAKRREEALKKRAAEGSKL